METKEKEKEGDETKRDAQPDRARFAHGHSGVVQLDTDHVVDAKADSSKAFFCLFDVSSTPAPASPDISEVGTLHARRPQPSFRSEVFLASGSQFWLFESSPAPGLVYLL